LNFRSKKVPEREQSRRLTYNDIGGLSREISRVREMIELPLRHPELFRKLGVEPPKGILLHGPPGCGKTMIARAVAHEAGVPFLSVNGPEIIQQHYGESEAHLRKIFEAAQQHPAAIIFLDEIDAVAPARDVVLGDVEKRVVAQLLALMDGLHGRGHVIVIAATNLPNAIDSALRRPGRFDREIEINPPDKHGRLEILKIHTHAMPLARDVDLERIAAATHGFLGADLAALCREAAMLCAQEAIPRTVADGPLPQSLLSSVIVSMTHFERARGEIDLSTTRQVFSEAPDVTLADVGGLEDVKALLREAVEWPLKYADRFAHARSAAPKGILLTGAPGTGKSFLAKAIAGESGVNFISVKGPELLSKWVGDSEKGVRDVFKKARQASPAILFFDEVDTILPKRGQGSNAGNISERMVGQFLLELDNIDQLTQLVVLCATNRPDLIDPALIRPGRLDLVIELPLPDKEARRAILGIQLKGKPVDADVSADWLAAQTEGMNGAELGALSQRAAMLAIRESIARDPSAKFQSFTIGQAHFSAALAERKPRHAS